MIRTTRKLVLPALLGLIPVLAACDNDGDPMGPSTRPASLELVTPGVLTVESLEDTFRIEARVIGSDGNVLSAVPVAYWTLTPDVLAPASEAGTFRSVAAGRAYVQVAVDEAYLADVPREARDAFRYRVEVLVEQRPTRLAIGRSAQVPGPSPDGVVRLWALGQESMLRVWTADANGHAIAPVTTGLQWSSADGAIAGVDAAGRIEAIADGTSTIRVQRQGFDGEISVTVDASLELTTCVSAATTGAPACDRRNLVFTHGKPSGDR